MSASLVYSLLAIAAAYLVAAILVANLLAWALRRANILVDNIRHPKEKDEKK